MDGLQNILHFPLLRNVKNHFSISAQGFNSLFFFSIEEINLTDLCSYLFSEEG